MSDFKDRMIEAVERGWTTEDQAYEYVRESYADAADVERKHRKEHFPGGGWCPYCASYSVLGMTCANCSRDFR